VTKNLTSFCNCIPNVECQVRAKQAKKLELEMTRSTEDTKRLEMLQRLPELTRILRTYPFHCFGFGYQRLSGGRVGVYFEFECKITKIKRCMNKLFSASIFFVAICRKATEFIPNVNANVNVLYPFH